MDFHFVEARIRYLTPGEGGRKTGVASGYRGQFYYDGEDYDGFQYFPDQAASEFVELGKEVRAFVRFLADRWERVHRHELQVGKDFEIREGARVVGRGVVTRMNVSPDECANFVTY